MIAFLGVGANRGDPLAQCERALEILGSIQGITVVGRSSWYVSSPVGVRDQDDFINGVVEIRTYLTPRNLLDTLKTVEVAMGRQEGQRWGPREIDLDIIFYGQEVIREGDLIIPHPECHRRRFVLEPLCEIAPYVVHPCFGVSVRGLLDRLGHEGGWVRKR